MGHGLIQRAIMKSRALLRLTDKRIDDFVVKHLWSSSLYSRNSQEDYIRLINGVSDNAGSNVAEISWGLRAVYDAKVDKIIPRHQLVQLLIELCSRHKEDTPIYYHILARAYRNKRLTSTLISRMMTESDVSILFADESNELQRRMRRALCGRGCLIAAMGLVSLAAWLVNLAWVQSHPLIVAVTMALFIVASWRMFHASSAFVVRWPKYHPAIRKYRDALRLRPDLYPDVGMALDILFERLDEMSNIVTILSVALGAVALLSLLVLCVGAGKSFWPWHDRWWFVLLLSLVPALVLAGLLWLFSAVLAYEAFWRWGVRQFEKRFAEDSAEQWIALSILFEKQTKTGTAASELRDRLWLGP